MVRRVTVRLDPEIAAWLESAAERNGVSKSGLIRNLLNSARAEAEQRRFLKLAGGVRGPKDLSTRRGLSPS